MRQYILLTTLLISSFSFTQSLLHLKSGEYDLASVQDVSENRKGDNYFILVFNQTPSQAEKELIESTGILIYNYLPDHAFYAFIPTTLDFNNTSLNSVTKVIPIHKDYKLSSNLKNTFYPDYAIVNSTYIDLIAQYFDNYSFDELNNLLPDKTTVLDHDRLTKKLTIRVPIESLEEIYQIDALYYFEEIAPPAEPEDLMGRVSHRSNTLRSDNGIGLFYRGDGVRVMVQDDGYIGDHIDYKGRVDESNCFCSPSISENHGDHVSGILMGAGNLDPKGRGMADGVDLFTYNSVNSNYSLVPNLYTNDSIVITSKSYGDGCNLGYTSLTSDLDQQVRLYPSLTHVFSAGNSGSSDCGYGAGIGWGNITGGHKSGKNVYAIGNIKQNDAISSSSSRGPATDGRIKPDICALGTNVYSTIADNTYATFSGTSMACPGVAGTIAQLYEAYQDDFGTYPDAGLIKGCILNTGEDLGNPGPDFTYGWGRINARRAYQTFHNNQFIVDNISQGENKTFSLNVPSNLKELRVMVYWTDFEGSTSASVALVNDINMTIQDPGLTDYNPWILDPTPNATALNTPAVRGIDNLNNMEQVTIEDPAAGNYQISIDGFNIPEGPQQFFIVYYFVEDNITVTHPNGGESFEPGTFQSIRWDANTSSEYFKLEYTIDNGSNWTPIDSVAGDRLFYSWSVPNELTGLARIRIYRNTNSDVSDSTFSILDIPENLNFNWACPDSTQITWDVVPGATGYEISGLGEKYMDSLGTSITNSFTILVPSTDTNWYSVRALGPDNARSERQIAIQKTSAEFNCFWSAPYTAFSINCVDPGTGYCSLVTNECINSDGTANYSWYFPGGTPSTSSDVNPSVCYSSGGDFDVALVVDNGYGIDSIYSTNAIHILNTATLPYFEGFEYQTNFSSTEEWSVTNEDNNQTWQVLNSVGLNSNKSAYLDNYTQSGSFIDELISGPVDLSSIVSSVTLSFRYSYRKKASWNDEWLRIFVREDCADTWTSRKTIHGSFLSDQIESNAWVPSTDLDWTTVHVTNITSTFYSADFRFKFQFESDFGNNMYLDNINIYEGSPSEDLITNGINESILSLLSVYPNPADNELYVSYNIGSGETTSINITDVYGKVVQKNSVQSNSGSNLAILDLSSLSNGVYFIRLTVGSESTYQRVVIQ